MKLIIGLGNPGQKYESTRHNIGFIVVDELAKKWTEGKVEWQQEEKSNSLILKFPNSYARAHLGGNFSEEIWLVKPQSFMNASGQAVAKVLRYYDTTILREKDLWVIHDDVDLPLGKIKIRLGGAAAGHHGVESIIAQLGTDKFLRFRLGIGHPRLRPPSADFGGQARKKFNIDVEDYVLKSFEGNEKTELKHMIKQALLSVEVALREGPEKAMNQFNR